MRSPSALSHHSPATPTAITPRISRLTFLSCHATHLYPDHHTLHSPNPGHQGPAARPWRGLLHDRPIGCPEHLTTPQVAPFTGNESPHIQCSLITTHRCTWNPLSIYPTINRPPRTVTLPSCRDGPPAPSPQAGSPRIPAHLTPLRRPPGCSPFRYTTLPHHSFCAGAYLLSRSPARSHSPSLVLPGASLGLMSPYARAFGPPHPSAATM